jgi:PAS domain S-box-containing protein
MSAFAGPGEVRSILRSIDWAATPMGPVAAWPQSLRATVKTLLGSRYPMVLLWGADTLIQIYNDAYTSLIGDKHPQALGRSIKVTQAESWDTIGPMIQAVMTTGIPNWVPAQRLAVNRAGFDEEAYFSLSYSPVEDDAGRISGMLCVCSEVTRQVLAERRLQLQRDLGARAMETRDAVAACRDMAATLAAAPADISCAMLHLRDATGALRREAVVADAPGTAALAALAGQGDWLARAGAGETVLVEDPAALAGLRGGPWNRPLRAGLALPLPGRTSSPPLGVLLAGISPSCALDGEYRTFLGLVAGQVALAIRNARAHEEERRRTEELAELDRAKTAFFSNVSHEFRTPLTLMLGPLEDALADAPARLPAHRDALDVARRNALRLLRLVNTLLDFSRLEAARAQPRCEPLDLAAVTADLAAAFRSAMEKAGLALHVDCPPLPRPVLADGEMWEKVVLNLLSNAFKFTAAGHVALRLAPDGEDGVELSVADTGAGIPAAELPRLFERFHRIEGQWSRSHEGSGIGLALVRQLVELHGGRIAAESAGPGQGSTFRLRLPYAPPGLEAAPEPAPGPMAGGTAIRPAAFVEEALRWLPAPGPAAAAPPGGAQGPRVLVVDDNADMRLYVERLLAPSYAVQLAADGAAALASVAAGRPDLVIADIMMPGLDGMALLRRLRADPATAAIPVIFLSARAGDEARVEGLSAGADDYLVKPFQARELLARVEGAIRLSRLRAEAGAREAQLESRLTLARAETARAQSERQLRVMADALPAVIADVGPDLRYRFANAMYEEWFGIAPAALIGKSMPELVGPVGWEVVRHHVAAALAGERQTYKALVPYRIGAQRYVQVEYIPHRREDGTPDGFFALVQDVTAREAADRHRELLLNELNHRVKNTLAVVQAIAAQSFRDPAIPAGVRESFEGRLMALSRMHDLLMHEDWERATLPAILAEAVRPFNEGGRIAIAVPPLRLGAKVAESLSLALHELCTNACKYGALSQPAGQVAIRGSVTEGPAPRLDLTWQEEGGPPVVAPARRGFGSRLIERGLAAELDAEVSLQFRAEGLVFRLCAPLSQLEPRA